MRSNQETRRTIPRFWTALAIFALGVSLPLTVSALRQPPPVEPAAQPAPPAAAATQEHRQERRLMDDRRTPVVLAAERASPAVVAIEVGRENVGFFRRRGVRGEGSGVLINSRGFLLTNYHVVRSASAINVHLTDGRSFPADMVAHGEASDIAVLRVRAPGEVFPYIRVATSSDLLPGETVLALGNPYGLQHTVSTGVISAVDRTVQLPNGEKYHDFLQTDAAINPGNSGGPLININGEIIGLNTAIFNQGWGIAFAIPIDRIRDLLRDYVIRNHNLGVEVEPVQGGLRITRVDSERRASGDRLRERDVIQRINGQPVAARFDLTVAALGASRREPLRVGVERGGQPYELEVGPWGVDEEIGEALWARLGVRGKPGATRVADGRRREGFLVETVRKGGPAASIDIRPGDLLYTLRVDAQGRMEQGRQYRVRNPQDLLTAVREHPGEFLRVQIVRKGRYYDGVIQPESR